MVTVSNYSIHYKDPLAAAKGPTHNTRDPMGQTKQKTPPTHRGPSKPENSNGGSIGWFFERCG